MTLISNAPQTRTENPLTFPTLANRAALKLVHLVECGLRQPATAEQMRHALSTWGDLDTFKESLLSADISTLSAAYRAFLPALARLWERNLLEINLPPRSTVSRFYISPTGDRVIASISSPDSGHLFLNVLTGQVFKHANRAIRSLEDVIFLPNSPVMFGQVRFDDCYALFDLISGEVLDVGGSSITAVQRPIFSPDGTEAILPIHLAWNARLLHLPSGAILDTALSLQHLRDITFSPDGSKILAWASRMGCSREERNVVVDVRTGALAFDRCYDYSHAEPPLFTPDGAHAYSRVRMRGVSHVVDMVTSELLTIPGVQIHEVMRPTLSPNGGEAFAHVRINDSYHLLELFSRTLLPEPREQITFLALDQPVLSPDGTKVLSAVSAGNTWWYLDGRTGALLAPHGVQIDQALAPTFSPDGRVALGRVKVGDSWRILDVYARAFLPPHDLGIEMIGAPVFSSDSTRAYTVCRRRSEFFYVNLVTGSQTPVPLANLTEADPPIVLTNGACAFARVSVGGINSVIDLWTGAPINCPGKQTTNVYLLSPAPELNTAFAVVRNSDTSCAIADLGARRWVEIPGARVSYVSPPLICPNSKDVFISCGVDEKRRVFNVSTGAFVALPDGSDISWQDAILIKDRALLLPVSRTGGGSALFDLSGSLVSRLNESKISSGGAS